MFHRPFRHITPLYGLVFSIYTQIHIQLAYNIPIGQFYKKTNLPRKIQCSVEWVFTNSSIFSSVSLWWLIMAVNNDFSHTHTHVHACMCTHAHTDTHTCRHTHLHLNSGRQCIMSVHHSSKQFEKRRSPAPACTHTHEVYSYRIQKTLQYHETN